MNIWALIFLIALGTFTWRAFFFGELFRKPLPKLVEKSLVYVPSSALTVLIVPGLIYQNDSFSGDYTKLVAAIFAFLLAHFSKNVLITLFGGMLFFLLIRLI